MSALGIIADDVTGACDVASSFAAAGVAVRIVCDVDDAAVAAADAYDEALEVVNTQSRNLAPPAAAARVRRAVERVRAPLLVKKIDTALRGHLGAELDAAIDALGARAAFVVAAIPAAGRVTRAGRQWFGDRELAATEFARDPEGPGAESSIAAVIARESDRPTSLVGLDEVRGEALAATLRGALERGAAHVIVDAETDADVRAAVAAILALPGPLCVAGSIALATAVAAAVAAPDGGETLHAADCTRRSPRLRTVDRERHRAEAARADGVESQRSSSAPTPAIPSPALVVCGSLHTTARSQVDALVAAGIAVALRTEGPQVGNGETVAAAAGALAAGRNVVLAAPPAATTPDADALRTTERRLAELTAAIVAVTLPRTLVLIGGETSYAVVRRLAATAVDVHGRFVPLVAVGRIRSGVAAGVTLVTKGGSGGDREALVRLLAAPASSRACGVAAPG